ncbi:MAG TPA: hypothetical protein V6D22_21070 [Candidatus Obscuribacterales bacterium]
MDAKKENQTQISSALKTVRMKAVQQKQVRLKRTVSEEAAEPRSSWQGIKTLKAKVAEEEPLESAQPSILAKMWSNFQEMLGNK